MECLCVCIRLSSPSDCVCVVGWMEEFTWIQAIREWWKQLPVHAVLGVRELICNLLVLVACPGLSFYGWPVQREKRNSMQGRMQAGELTITADRPLNEEWYTPLSARCSLYATLPGKLQESQFMCGWVRWFMWLGIAMTALLRLVAAATPPNTHTNDIFSLKVEFGNRFLACVGQGARIQKRANNTYTRTGSPTSVFSFCTAARTVRSKGRLASIPCVHMFAVVTKWSSPTNIVLPVIDRRNTNLHNHCSRWRNVPSPTVYLASRHSSPDSNVAVDKSEWRITHRMWLAWQIKFTRAICRCFCDTLRNGTGYVNRKSNSY